MTLVIERRSKRSHPVENWLWEGLWTGRKADYRMAMLFVLRLSAYGFPPSLLDVIVVTLMNCSG